MNRRLRIGLLAVAGLVAAIVVAALIAMYVVLQPERFTALLQSRARAAGLELTLASPASPTLWPKPSLELDGITLRGNAGGTPLIVASRGKLVLPWRTLMGGEATISRLEVEGARIDLDAVSAYIDSLPPRPSTAGAILPAIDAGFRVSRSTLLRGNRLLLSNVDIDAGRLANDHRFTLTINASTADDAPYALDLATTPSLARGILTLDDLDLDIAGKGRFSATLRGDATWRGGADVGASMAGRVTRTAAAPYDVVLGITPANQQDPLSIAMKIDGEQDHADLHLPPLALADWWTGMQAGHSPTLPPVQGSVDATQVDIGSVHIKGLRVRATPVSPAASSTVIAPAASP
ncbi:MAG TPA: AsmA family protein [Luteibacter sp.]|uniref:AsmA family protein n=1 Tax=Luteibacter sp. TaxID=1886636 RepID=UPI002C09BE73|nr:AsmA family protein [Luteibacter sp.]HVI54093.1 AsmA family protein [Luteibacter sp.]